MSVLGMGPMEILVVLLIAFIVLGPERMVSTARMLGRTTGELRRIAEGLPKITLDDDHPYPPDKPIVHRGGGPNPSVGAGPEPESDGRPEGEDDTSQGRGPVAFKPSTGADSEDGSEQSQAGGGP